MHNQNFFRGGGFVEIVHFEQNISKHFEIFRQKYKKKRVRRDIFWSFFSKAQSEP